MSKHHVDSYQCPNCGHNQDITIWESVNVQLNPETKEKIVNNDFFTQTCSKCNVVVQVVYSFLYHDMEEQLMIYMIAEKDPDAIKDQIENMKTIGEILNSDKFDKDLNFGTLGDNYRNRIVLGNNSLLEKIMISKNKLDDRIIEIMKVLYFSQLSQQGDEEKISELLFHYSEEDNKNTFIAFTEDNGSAALNFDNDLYASLEEKILPALIELTPKGYAQIDFDWALDALSKV